jgi:hypothetical protein
VGIAKPASAPTVIAKAQAIRNRFNMGLAPLVFAEHSRPGTRRFVSAKMAKM